MHSTALGFSSQGCFVLENQIHPLSEVKGIAKKRIVQIQKTWNDQKTISRLVGLKQISSPNKA